MADSLDISISTFVSIDACCEIYREKKSVLQQGEKIGEIEIVIRNIFKKDKQMESCSAIKRDDGHDEIGCCMHIDEGTF